MTMRLHESLAVLKMTIITAVVTMSLIRHQLDVQLRKILKPAFSLGAINEFAPSMAGVARRCCDKWAGQGRVGGMLAAKEYTFLVGEPGWWPCMLLICVT